MISRRLFVSGLPLVLAGCATGSGLVSATRDPQAFIIQPCTTGGSCGTGPGTPTLTLPKTALPFQFPAMGPSATGLASTDGVSKVAGWAEDSSGTVVGSHNASVTVGSSGNQSVDLTYNFTTLGTFQVSYAAPPLTSSGVVTYSNGLTSTRTITSATSATSTGTNSSGQPYTVTASVLSATSTSVTLATSWTTASTSATMHVSLQTQQQCQSYLNGVSGFLDGASAVLGIASLSPAFAIAGPLSLACGLVSIGIGMFGQQACAG